MIDKLEEKGLGIDQGYQKKFQPLIWAIWVQKSLFDRLHLLKNDRMYLLQDRVYQKKQMKIPGSDVF